MHSTQNQSGDTNALTSSGLLYSTISVHRLLHFMVPRFCWLDFLLQWSLYSMYGVPVSVCDSIIAYHNCWALIVFLPLPSFSYLKIRKIIVKPDLVKGILHIHLQRWNVVVMQGEFFKSYNIYVMAHRGAGRLKMVDLYGLAPTP